MSVGISGKYSAIILQINSNFKVIVRAEEWKNATVGIGC